MNSIPLANSQRGDTIRGDKEKGLSTKETKRYFFVLLDRERRERIEQQ
jgi:hypothetical protein